MLLVVGFMIDLGEDWYDGQNGVRRWQMAVLWQWNLGYGFLVKFWLVIEERGFWVGLSRMCWIWMVAVRFLVIFLGLCGVFRYLCNLFLDEVFVQRRVVYWMNLWGWKAVFGVVLEVFARFLRMEMGVHIQEGWCYCWLPQLGKSELGQLRLELNHSPFWWKCYFWGQLVETGYAWCHTQCCIVNFTVW